MRRRNIVLLYIIIFVFSVGLIFNHNIWFDESYTLSLIKHNYLDVIDILRDDMHPPLYFISLKFFCAFFGSSILVTKLFSALGLLSTLILGCTIVNKDYGEKVAVLYGLFIAAVPMMYYFSVQQRCYSWCIFGVTFCFLMGQRLLHHPSYKHAVLFAIMFLFSAYNHIYALVAVGGMCAFINIYTFIYQRKYIRSIMLANIIIIIGYIPWLFTLLLQTQSAVSDFWLKRLEPLSLFIFGITILLFGFFVRKKKWRKLPVLFGMFSVLFVQIVGIGISFAVRPLYIARYASPLIGVFAFVLAVCFENAAGSKKIIIAICCVILVQYIGTIQFEYSSSLSDFQSEFSSDYNKNDIFIYTDSSFGVMSYYYPENRHVCFYYETWFRAFENVLFVKENSSLEQGKIWYIVNAKSQIPIWVKEKWKMHKNYSFRNDFNGFDVYLMESSNIK